MIGLVQVLLLSTYIALKNNGVCIKERAAGAILGRFTKTLVDFCVFTLGSVCIWLSGSRTAVAGLLLASLFLVRSDRYNSALYRLFALLVLLCSSLLLIFLVFDSFYQGLLGEAGSMNLKFEILFDYLKNSSINALVFGGHYDTFFDFEYGYWLGSAGIIGTFAIALMFKNILQAVPSALPAVILYAVLSFGNTVLFGLLSSLIVLVLIVVCAQSARNS